MKDGSRLANGQPQRMLRRNHDILLQVHYRLDASQTLLRPSCVPSEHTRSRIPAICWEQSGQRRRVLLGTRTRRHSNTLSSPGDFMNHLNLEITRAVRPFWIILQLVEAEDSLLRGGATVAVRYVHHLAGLPVAPWLSEPWLSAFCPPTELP